MHNDVGAVINRFTQIRRCQSVIDNQWYAGLTGYPGDCLDIGNDSAGVGNRLDEDRLGLRCNRLLKRADVVGVGPYHVPSEILESVIELVDRAAVELSRSDE